MYCRIPDRDGHRRFGQRRAQRRLAPSSAIVRYCCAGPSLALVFSSPLRCEPATTCHVDMAVRRPSWERTIMAWQPSVAWLAENGTPTPPWPQS